MRYLTPEQVLALHGLVISQSGGRPGVRDYGALESAVAQPGMTFDQTDLYPTLAQKAAALAYSLIQNHPFIDGNKRVAKRLWKPSLCSTATSWQRWLTSRRK